MSNLASNAINKFERKNKWKRSCQNRKRIYFVHCERESLLEPLTPSLVQPMISTVVKVISAREIRGYMYKVF